MKNKEFDFIGNFRLVIIISLSIFLIGIVSNFIFGTKLDINFKGGTIISYSHTGEISEKKAAEAVKAALKQDISVTSNEDLIKKTKSLVVTLIGNKSLNTAGQKTITDALTKTFKDNKITLLESSTVSAKEGVGFFQKSLYAVFLACLFVVIYVAFRFRKIGGVPAGAMALVSLFHDIILVYFIYVILRIPLNENFIAVLLTILGYSLNDTIVIYDRIRENGKTGGNAGPFRSLVNHSINQSFKRSVVTVLTVFLSITIVYVVALIRGLDSIVSFALPMSIGILSGCYSSIFVATPLWVFWHEHQEKKALLTKPEKVEKIKA